MLLPIPDVLTSEQVAEARQILEQADWVDGRVTAGHQSAKSKDNMQLPENHPAARQLGEMILTALGQNALFVSAALPARVFPPLFNRYQGGQSFGTHVDNAIRQVTGTGHRIRTDLSATLFFSQPDEYDGGELDRRRYLRPAPREASRGPHDSLSLDQPAPCHARDARGAGIFILLDPEHGARRRPAHSAFRSRHRHPASQRRPSPTIPRSCSLPASITTCCGAGQKSDPGYLSMTPRRFLFWVHLAAGSVAGLVIFVMSVTGVLLAYKRQILNRADRGFQSQPPPGAQRLPVDELLAKLQIAQNKMPSGITVRSAPAAPVCFRFWPRTYRLRRSLHRAGSWRRVTQATRLLFQDRGCASLAGNEQ